MPTRTQVRGKGAIAVVVQATTETDPNEPGATAQRRRFFEHDRLQAKFVGS